MCMLRYNELPGLNPGHHIVQPIGVGACFSTCLANEIVNPMGVTAVPHSKSKGAKYDVNISKYD